MKNIYLANLQLKHGKKSITVRDMIVTGDNKDDIVSDKWYLRSACLKIGVKDLKKQSDYSIEDVDYIKFIGETNY